MSKNRLGTTVYGPSSRRQDVSTAFEDLEDRLSALKVEAPSWAKSPGRKDDSGKSRLDLMPPKAEVEVGHVLGFGAKKYGDENWRLVGNAKSRYLAAARRHIAEFQMGSSSDADSSRHPLAHAICSLLFVLELELSESGDVEP